MKTTYTYTVLRYAHDPSTGEFVNVGVALLAPEVRFAGSLCRNTYERFSGMFPDFDGQAFRSLTRYVDSRFRVLGEKLRAEGLLEAPKSVMELAHEVLPRDDGSFQWSEPAGGVTDDPAGALRKIYARMVSRYDAKPEEGGRNDEDVRDSAWQELDRRGVSRYLGPKTITAPHEERLFPYAHKNGVWSCVDGMSLDLIQPESIRRKARQWLGMTVGLSKSPETFKLYLLLGEPPQPDATVRRAIRRAIDLLGEMPVDHRIVRQGEAASFADEFSEEIRAYENGA